MMDAQPQLVCLNETLLDASTEESNLQGYALIGRRGRPDRAGGGVAVFAHTDFAEAVNVVATSAEAERLWCVVHSDLGPISVGAWYRPPAPGDVDTITSCAREWQSQGCGAMGTILVGDCNVHSRRWLKHSNGESCEGTALRTCCQEVGASQLVRDPTRGALSP